MCDEKTDWYCRDCDQPVCENCVVQMTYHNQVDFTLCQECQDTREAQDYLERSKEWKIEAVVKAKKEARNKARQIAYWKPEAVKKRRLAKELRQREEAELYIKRMKETLKVVRGMFR